ncbi:hypothetical protein DFH09DRAFT_1450895 [Mycena vulgaris]|nr:hypothetical protein DFH09DRAFT_1450895 [Mycena vulgaris]
MRILELVVRRRRTRTARSSCCTVPPNQYLYNNIISKLAKARKADYALELFEDEGNGTAGPSSITYGAVIGACARVGTPRVPPFNTMMQLYTTTKPNRDRALFFYNELRRAQVPPTAYTYKAIAYGRMEQIWEALLQDNSVELQGNHFASLIHAYGCVQKDLDKAVSVFNSIPTFRRAPPRDALVFEAMINTLGVHMTAYIANFLIKGYADVGDMDQARAIFESLPATSPVIDPLEPVYREPSTWEVMRLQARCYPEAVFNRISGILIDHSTVLS